MPNTPTHPHRQRQANRPTAKQLNYLRSLAAKTGTSFTPPGSRTDASEEINRLKSITNTGMTFAELASESAARQVHCDPPLPYSPAIQDDEISGYGSTATWNRS